MATFRIGSLDLAIDHGKSQWEITTFVRNLAITLVARVPNAVTSPPGILSDYNPRGEVIFRTSLRGIYRDGYPEGRFEFEENRYGLAQNTLYLNTEGLDYRLKYNGTLSVSRHGVEVRGQLVDRFGEIASQEVTIDLELDPNVLDWSDYDFTTLEELEGAPESTVRYLKLFDLSQTELPDRFRHFSELRQLIVYGPGDRRLPLTKIPRWIGRLRQLTDLQFTNCSLPLVPHEIGELKQLVTFGVSHCGLRVVPVSVLHLPNLQYLYLSGNRLTELNGSPQLPSLKTINLDKNQLTYLSEAWATLPALRRIDLTSNPLKRLPQIFLDLSELVMDVADKQALFDFSYPGAGGRGTVEWDDRMYYAKSRPELLLPVDNELYEDDLLEYREPLLHLAKLALAYRQTEEENYARVGNTRFGGMPDLPAGVLYPTFGMEQEGETKTYHYEFIAQLDCNEVAPLQQYLPRSGVLYFFLSTIHDIYGGAPDTYSVGHVIHSMAEESLVSGAQLSLNEADYFEMIGSEYQGFKAEVRAAPMLPSFYAIGQNEYLLDGPAAVLRDLDDEVFEQFDYVSETLGAIFPADHYVNGYGFSQHEFPEVEAANARRGRPQDWLILLTVSSRGDMQWGDAGDIFFLIHKSDLSKRDFSNVVVTMYSS